jgi:hypothetical protein
MPCLHRRSLLALGTFLAIASPGCALDWEGDATVRFFATHAGTPSVEGIYPDYGDEETTRVFVTDMGWQIDLTEVFITTAEVRFIRCQESTGTPIEMFWGPCPESFVSTDDLESVPLGAVSVDDGRFCGIDVVFGPFVPPPDGDEHIAVGNPLIEGNTFVVNGFARRGEPPMIEEYPFSIVSDVEVIAHLDTSTLEDDGPIVLEKENFPRDLTIIKTYDRFFDGIDFASATSAELEAAILSGLERQTVVFDGTYD